MNKTQINNRYYTSIFGVYGEPTNPSIFENCIDRFEVCAIRAYTTCTSAIPGEKAFAMCIGSSTVCRDQIKQMELLPVLR